MPERTAGTDPAVPGLDIFLSGELESAAPDSSRLCLLGFNQGTMMALHFGLQRPAARAGMIEISRMVVAPGCPEEEIGNCPPVLLIHRADDEIVTFQLMGLASVTLKAARVPIETQTASHVGHWLSPDDLEAVFGFARRAFP